MGSTVQLRQMMIEDVPRVMQIERACFAIPWNESAYITEITNKSAYYVVACVDSEIVGYAGMWIIMDESHITTIGVALDHRGKKIGEALLVAMLDEVMQRGAYRATLEVRQSNEVAQNLYRKYGFIPAAIRRGYYTDNYEDAVVMWVDNLNSTSFLNKYRVLKQSLADNVGKFPLEDLA